MSIIVKRCIINWLNISIDATKDTLKVGRMLTLSEFINYTKFNIDDFSMRKFYYNMYTEIPIYIDNSIIEWFGYKGFIREQRKQIRRMLQNNFSDYKDEYWFEYSNLEYKEFYKKNSMGVKTPIENMENLYPDPIEFKGKNKIKHLIIHPTIFKHIVLMADTKNSMNIRNYYIALEDLIKKYTQYQAEVIKSDNISLKDLLKETNIILKENEKKAEEERKKAEEERKKADERFNRLLGVAEDTKEEVLEKIGELAETRLDLSNVVHDRVSTKRVPANKISYFVILKDTDDEKVPYYVLRAQRKSVSRKITEMQKDYNVQEVFRIYEPNAVNFWISVCDKLSSNIRKSPTQNWFALRNITESEFKRQVIDMDKSERQNPKYI
jgi:hypothetical protein